MLIQVNVYKYMRGVNNQHAQMKTTPINTITMIRRHEQNERQYSTIIAQTGLHLQEATKQLLGRYQSKII